ncbi:MAG: PEGA domain-containing protein [bacterium]
MKRLIMSVGFMFALMLVTSCATTRHELKAGSSRLVVAVIPDPYDRWESAKVYLNGHFVDTAVPGSDQKTYDLAQGNYDVKVITDGYETCEGNVSLIEGRKQHYIEFHPKKVFRRSMSAALRKFFSN